MNFLTKLLDSIVDFVKRMPLFAIFAWRLRRVQRDLHEQFRRAGEQSGHQHYSYRRKASNEGDVSIHATTAMPEKKVSDDVGEYVDFKEEKINDK